MNSDTRLRAALGAVSDPELGGVTIGELGMVVAVRVDGDSVHIELSPTFLGCPALDFIRADVTRAARREKPNATVDVRFVNVPVWTPDRISESGRRQLATLGIAVPDRTGSAACPYCGGLELRAAGSVGPTACRSVAWCGACRNVVELMRRADEPVAVSITGRRTYAHI